MVRRVSYNNNYTAGVSPSGLYRAEVVAVNGSLLSVKIPKLAQNVVYENVPFTGFLPAPGDHVWAAFVEGKRNFPVVIAGASDVDSDITEIVAGVNLDGGGTSGVVTIDLADDVSLAGSLSVTGAASLSDVVVSDDLNVSGTTWASDIYASGSASVNGWLDVNGAASLSDIYASGNVDVTGTFDVTGMATMASLTVTDVLDAAHINGQLDGPLLINVKYTDSTSAAPGTPVYVSGAVGASGTPEVKKADASNIAKMPCIGVTQYTMVNGDFGHVIVTGVLKNFDTSAYAVNDELFVGVGGGLTATHPSRIYTEADNVNNTPYVNQHVAKVIRSHANSGQLLINATSRSEFESVVSILEFVVDDGTTDNAAAINAAIAATPPGGVLDFRGLRNHLRVASPVFLKERRTYLFANTAGMWPYRQINSNQSYFTAGIKALSSFSGEAVVQIVDTTSNTDTITVMGMAVDVSAVPTPSDPNVSISGVLVKGLVRDIKFEDCSVHFSRGTNGVCWNFASDTTGVPRGVRMSRCVANNSAGAGFRFTSTTDFAFHDLLASNCAGEGFYHSGPGAGVYMNCTSAFNQVGYKIERYSRLGQVSFVGCLTDRNQRQGVLITDGWTGGTDVPADAAAHTILFSGCQFRRDGYDNVNNASVSIGIHVSGTSSTYKAAPIDIVGCQVVVEQGDAPGSGLPKDDNYSPLSAIRVVNAERVSIVGGFFWGETNASVTNGSCALTLGGTNSIVEWSPQTYFARTVSGSNPRARERDPNVPSMVGAQTLTIAQGGTGGSTPGTARSSLGVAPNTPSYVVGAANTELTSELVLGTQVIMSGNATAASAISAGSLTGSLYHAASINGGTLYRNTSGVWTQVAAPVSTQESPRLKAFEDSISASPPVVASGRYRFIVGRQNLSFSNPTIGGSARFGISSFTLPGGGFTGGLLNVLITPEVRGASSFFQNLVLLHNPLGFYATTSTSTALSNTGSALAGFESSGSTIVLFAWNGSAAIAGGSSVPFTYVACGWDV